MYTVETFRNEIDYHPYHFWQQSNSEVPVTSECNTLVFENSWKAGASGRAEIKRAIKSARSKILKMTSP